MNLEGCKGPRGTRIPHTAPRCDQIYTRLAILLYIPTETQMKQMRFL